MASLTETANTVKKTGVLGIIIGITIIILIVSLVAAVSIKNKYFPAKAKPNILSQFGKLVPINFLAKNPLDATKLNFQVETISGGLGVLPTEAKVYKFVDQNPGVLALENAKLKAEKMGFVAEPRLLEGSVYQWVDDLTGRTLTYNTTTRNFNIKSDRIFSPEYVSVRPPGNEEAIRTAKNWLSTNGLGRDDFEENKIVTTPIKVEVTQLQKALALSEANYVRVSFKRKNVDDIPLVESSESGLVSLLITGRRGKEAVAEVDYRYNPIDLDTVSYYPLTTSEEAFALLKSGEGKIISSPVVSGTVFIRKVYLGYYLSDYDEQYVQPVVVFDSLDGFLAVVPAVKADQFVPDSQKPVVNSPTSTLPSGSFDTPTQ